MPQGRVASSGRHVAPDRVAPEKPHYHGRHASPPGSIGVSVLLPGADPGQAPAWLRTDSVLLHHRSRLRDALGPFLTLLAAAVVALLVKMFVIQAYVVPSGSMENTLRVGDRVATNRLSYELHDLHRGDVVVFSGAGTWNPAAPHRSGWASFWHALGVRAGVASADGTIYVKRVIGLPGDTVACCDAHGDVTVDGVALHESAYVDDNSYWSGSCTPVGVSPRCFGPVHLPAGMLWVMGDHRAVSDDSRRHGSSPGGGAVEESKVVGKAVVVLWPHQHWRTLGTPTTFAGVPAVAMLTLPLVRRRRRARRRLAR